MMKILLCTTTFTNITNGPTKFANFLYRIGTDPDKIEVHVLSEDIGEETNRLHKCHIGFLRKILPIAPVYRMIKYYYSARKLKRSFGFNFVVYNNAIYGIVHSLFEENVIGMINDYNNQQSIATRKYESVKKKIFRNFETLAIKSSKLILANSDYLTSLLQQSYPKYASKIVRLYKGIELFENRYSNSPEWEVSELEQVKILFVKNDFITGGLAVLADALSGIDLQFNVTIVGPDLKYASQINALFETGNVITNVLGRQSQEEIFRLMENHHIFCVPSLQEALGVANLEALHIGIPVVSSDAGGIPEVLDHGACGFISIAGNPESLRNSLENCLYKKNERIKKVVHGRTYVQKFRSELLIDNLQKILDESVQLQKSCLT